MSDITMCQNDECARKNTCYRYTAEPSDMQSYAVFDDKSDTSDKKQCEYYIIDHNSPIIIAAKNRIRSN